MIRARLLSRLAEGPPGRASLSRERSVHLCPSDEESRVSAATIIGNLSERVLGSS